MFRFLKRHVWMLAVVFCGTQMQAQFYNKEVEAKIVVTQSNELFEISGYAYNLSNLNKSLRYVLTVFSEDENGNKSKNSQEDRFILDSSERKMLSTTTVNSNTKNSFIILFLIYDEDKLIGKDRIVLNDTEAKDKDDQRNKVIVEKAEPIEDFAIRGIVTEDTKTKAGRDFYRMFYSLYTQVNINGPKVVSVKEFFSLGRTTKIEVLVDNKLVFQFFARPNEDFLKQMTKTAIYYVNDYFIKLKQNKNLITSY